MQTQEKPPGAALRDADEAQRKEAARMLGKAKTPAKQAASASNIAHINAERKTQGFSDATRAKLRTAWEARREREQKEKEEAGL